MNKDSYTCDCCLHSSSTRSNAFIHLLQSHSPPAWKKDHILTCDECQHSFHTRYHFTRHMGTHFSLWKVTSKDRELRFCDNCQYNDNSGNLHQHSCITKCFGLKLLCDQCNVKTLCRRGMQKHILSCFKLRGKLTCDNCSMSSWSWNKTNLSRHWLRSHSSNRVIMLLRTLAAHKSKLPKLYCDDCSHLSSRWDLHMHWVARHRKDSEDARRTRQAHALANRKRPKLVCDLCLCKFVRKIRFERHFSRNHSCVNENSKS